MLRTLYNGMSGLAAQMQRMDVTANNLANINTTGFKRQSVNFKELLRQRMALQGLPVLETEAATPTQGSGTGVSSTTRRFTQGVVSYTGRNLDLAIEGNGFFRVVREDGEVFYTRDGGFHVDENGRIVNSKGYALIEEELPENYNRLTVDESGRITCEDAGGNTREIGQIELALFPKPEGLMAVGDNLFGQTGESGEPVIVAPGEEAAGRIMQGYLENSNVDLVEEMQLLIESQRAFQLNAKSITTADQMWNIANNLQK